MLFFMQCRKDTNELTVHFYTHLDSSQAKLSLYVDDIYFAPLPNHKWLDRNIAAQLPLYTFKYGRHKVSAKDSIGNLKSEITGIVDYQEFSVNTNAGKNHFYAHMFIGYDTTLVDLYY